MEKGAVGPAVSEAQQRMGALGFGVRVTLMNGFLNMSFFVVCANVVVSLWVGWLDRHGQTAAGDLIDRRCRWVFPVVYLGLLLLVVGLTFFVVGSPG